MGTLAVAFPTFILITHMGREEFGQVEMNRPKVTAIILAAGSGSRMGADLTKQRIVLCGKSILYRSVQAFSDCAEISHIVVVSRPDELDWAKRETSSFSKLYAIVAGGKTRAESVKCGFDAIPSGTEFVAIHDGARCLIKQSDISSVLSKAYIWGAATACSSVTDTVKISDNDGLINATLPREKLYLASTPQVFKTDVYSSALLGADLDRGFTDDNMLIERIGGRVYPVDIGRENIKITTADDLSYAEYLINRRCEMSETRIGHGYDVHRFASGRRLVLGGVEIPFDMGLLGHSDADVLTHAIMDAILGAASLGDIGRHFPDNDPSFKDISSLKLLSKVAELIKSKGYSIVNIDATVIMQSPKISPYIDEMIDNLSNILGLDRGRINIKATTEEHLGFTGHGEGAAAHAVVLIKNKG